MRGEYERAWGERGVMGSWGGWVVWIERGAVVGGGCAGVGVGVEGMDWRKEGGAGVLARGVSEMCSAVVVICRL